MSAIETNKITKKYDKLIAVDAVSIKIEETVIFGLLGPNGAGKTTLISMLVTMKKPTSGSATVNGFDVLTQSEDVRKSIGIVFQDPSLDEELTAYENLELHAATYGVERTERKKRIEEVIEMVELKDRLYDIVKTFSGGMRRRLEIARALLHYPKVLFLDEPTIGLDPQTRAHVWEYVKKLKEEHGITILLTTHYMDEADNYCDKIAIIDKGKIMALGTSEELKNTLGGDQIVIESPEQENLVKAIEKLKWIKSAKIHEGKILINVEKGENKIPEIINLAANNEIEIDSVNLRKPTLDDVFMYYTGKYIREEEVSSKESFKLRRHAWGSRK